MVFNAIATSDIPIIGSADDPLLVESQTPNEFLVTFEHSQTSSTFNVPDSATHAISARSYCSPYAIVSELVLVHGYLNSQ